MGPPMRPGAFPVAPKSASLLKTRFAALRPGPCPRPLPSLPEASSSSHPEVFENRETFLAISCGTPPALPAAGAAPKAGAAAGIRRA